MKKLLIASILGIVFLSATLPSLAQETKVPQANTVDLSFDTKQIEQMLNKMAETSLTEADQAFIDSVLRNPLDKVAIDLAQEMIQRRMQWSMHELSELKKIVLRYLIVSEELKDVDYLKLLAREYTQSAQDHYNRALWSLAGASDELPGIIGECVTEVCAIQVTHALQELLDFVERVNKDLDFKAATSSVDLFWKFQNPILKTSLGKIFRKMIPNNEDHNAWKTAGAALLSPLSFAGQVVYSYGGAAATSLLNPRYLNIQFTVDEVSIDYGAIEKKLKRLISLELPEILRGREPLSVRRAREAREAEERRAREAREAEERRAREAREAEERRAREAKEIQDLRIRVIQTAEALYATSGKDLEQLRTMIENEPRQRADLLTRYNPKVVETILYIRLMVIDPIYLPSDGMLNIAQYYFDPNFAARTGDIKVGSCSVNLYFGHITGELRYDWNYESTYKNDLRSAISDIVKRLYAGKCDRQ